MHEDLVGITEIATLLGVSRQRADQLTRRPDFPEPLVTLPRRRAWERKKVEAWIQARQPHPNGGEI